MSQDLAIPTVDLDDLRAGGARRDAACAAIREGFGAYGLVYVRSHGIAPETLDAFYDAFVRFTSLREADKRRVARPEIWYQRGWTPPNTEQAVAGGGQPDFKECYFAATMPLDPECKTEHPEICAENVWPDDPRFAEVYTVMGNALHSVGQELLRGAAVALGLEERNFTDRIDGAAHVTRALRYIPLTPEQVEQGVLWGEEHTDFNLLTLLPGGRFIDPSGQRCPPPDPHSGLYLRTRATAEHPAGRKVRGAAPPGCLVAQVGQQWEILTGGTFQATPHVITAPKAPGYSRLSSAHFVHLHPHQVLTPLGPFRNEQTLRAYSPPVLAGTYDLKTLVDIALAPPAALNTLGYRHYDRLAEQRAMPR
ncbi:MAG: isopenicillin N synthase family oxygenase [Deltaproteobacteria bacterium]|nr:isopenicillin N synthase family oxygenase [Deltaproteobacteria bacterium]